MQRKFGDLKSFVGRTSVHLMNLAPGCSPIGGKRRIGKARQAARARMGNANYRGCLLQPRCRWVNLGQDRERIVLCSRIDMCFRFYNQNTPQANDLKFYRMRLRNIETIFAQHPECCVLQASFVTGSPRKPGKKPTNADSWPRTSPC